ncbi:MAG: hypothetical protein PHQ35_09650 [Phycisphaerae bacterium]|nr:hypothetical protein [Phycisphaerae bacterium]MDD5239979.1 hypothetical protein [Candidatus Nanoarchaeia archaeon]
MNPDSKVRVQYFSLTVESREFKFKFAGHCEQVLRGLVHSGYVVTIKEVSEVRTVSQDEIEKYRAENVNWSYVNDQKISGDCCTPQVTCNPTGTDR